MGLLKKSSSFVLIHNFLKYNFYCRFINAETSESTVQMSIECKVASYLSKGGRLLGTPLLRPKIEITRPLQTQVP